MTTTNFTSGAVRTDGSAADILADMSALFAAMPPVETWCSTVLAPNDSVTRITTPRENFMIAHPDVWATATRDVRPVSPSLALAGGMLSGIRIEDIDTPPDLSKPQLEQRVATWVRIGEAIAANGGEFPEWFRRR